MARADRLMTPGKEISYDLVVPTIGRTSLDRLLASLDEVAEPRPGRVVLVDDRAEPLDDQLATDAPDGIASLLRVIRSGGVGPAGARNIGWRACASEWVVFLDDDVVPGSGWGLALQEDLGSATPETVGVQGRIEVPLGERPTDWERNVAGLADASWATADMAYRRPMLELVGGFDERFTRAYREDADIALRLLGAGLRLERGNRTTRHPPGRERLLGSLARQRGNADDPMMTVVHGRRWRERAGAGKGTRHLHVITTLTGVAALSSDANRRRGLLASMWLLLTVRFGLARLRGGPWTPREIADMAVTSALIPPLATFHWMRGWARALSEPTRRVSRPGPGETIPSPVDAVFFDRDGTLIRDESYNGDPELVEPMPGAAQMLDRLRSRGIRTGVITNQSGVGRGLIDVEQMHAVNRRVDDLLGPFDTWQVCTHHPAEGCSCRKPAPGLLSKAAADVGIALERCLFIGDIGSDIEAARRAGCGHLLVPTERTEAGEVRSADNLASDLGAAYDRLLPHLGGVA